MIVILAFFFPLAVYLLVLGFLNRGRHPLLVSGVWDGIGLIFGVSGFLLFAGPAILSSLSERWRLFWLFGKGDVSLAGPNGAWSLWVFLALLYFLLVLSGAALYLWRQRHLTAIYNTNADLVERALTDVCAKLGIEPVCSGGLFLFGMPNPSRDHKRAEQTAIVISPSRDRKGADQPLSYGRGSDHGLEQSAILEVESFPLFHHVTLRWDPAASPVRCMVETELSRRLSETLADDSLLGGWLLSFGFALLLLDLLFIFAWILVNLQLFLR